MRTNAFSSPADSSDGERLSIQHFTRLRRFSRYTSHGEGLGWSLHGPIDDELASLGLLKPGGRGRGWFISELGEAIFAARSAHEAARRKPHNALANRASRWCNRQGRLAWLNRAFPIHLKPDLRVLQTLALSHNEFGPLFSGTTSQHIISRPDVISIMPSASRTDWNSWIFEVKVTRADFFQDVRNPGKRYAYALLAQQVFYLSPAGLISEEEVPEGCGLILETRPGAFSIVKASANCKPVRSAHINRLLRDK